MRLPVPAPANGHTDSATNAIGLALDAIEVEHPGGLVLPVAVLRDRVARFHQQERVCRFADVTAELPGLIRDLHTMLATGIDHGELLKLAPDRCGEHRHKAAPRPEPLSVQSRLPLGGIRAWAGPTAETPRRRDRPGTTRDGLPGGPAGAAHPLQVSPLRDSDFRGVP
ncbi:MAG: hypothetical protein ACRDTH_26505 [Pseudonocardiaceae bacterium]